MIDRPAKGNIRPRHSAKKSRCPAFFEGLRALIYYCVSGVRNALRAPPICTRHTRNGMSRGSMREQGR